MCVQGVLLHVLIFVQKQLGFENNNRYQRRQDNVLFVYAKFRMHVCGTIGWTAHQSLITSAAPERQSLVPIGMQL